RRIEVFVAAAIGMHTVEPPHHVVVHHVHHRLGHRTIPGFEGVHTFLDDDLVHFQPFLHHRHPVALAAVEADHFGGIPHRHHAHAVGAGIRLHDHERGFVDAVLAVFRANAGEQAVDLRREALLARALLEIDLPANAEFGIDAPRIDADH